MENDWKADMKSNGNEKDLKRLEQYLPWSLGVISLLKNNDFLDVYHLPESDFIAILNRYHEWIGFCKNQEDISEIIGHIKKLGRNCRIVITSRDKLYESTLGSFEGKSYHIEDFMIGKLNITKMPNEYILARKEDFADLARLQMDYCREEVSWSYHQKNLNDYYADYQKKIDCGNIFVYGNPVKSKVEIISSHLNFVKVGSVYTDKNYRGQGMAKMCLAGALNWCMMTSLIPCLNVRKDNLIAKRIYLKSGFEDNGEVLYYEYNAIGQS